MVERVDLGARVRRAEGALRAAEGLLLRRQTDLGGAGDTAFEDRLLQGVRELAAAVRELAAYAGHLGQVSGSHAAELSARATDLAAVRPWRSGASGPLAYVLYHDRVSRMRRPAV
jgi:hypothetical protein